MLFQQIHEYMNELTWGPGSPGIPVSPRRPWKKQETLNEDKKSVGEILIDNLITTPAKLHNYKPQLHVQGKHTHTTNDNRMDMTLTKYSY